MPRLILTCPQSVQFSRPVGHKILRHVVVLLSSISMGTALAGVTLSQCIIQASPATLKMTRAYVVIESSTADQLIGASFSSAKRSEIHQVKNIEGISEMSKIASLPIKTGTTALKKGDKHIMLMDLTDDVIAGKKSMLTLQFKQAGAVDCEAVGKNAADIIP